MSRRARTLFCNTYFTSFFFKGKRFDLVHMIYHTQTQALIAAVAVFIVSVSQEAGKGLIYG